MGSCNGMYFTVFGIYTQGVVIALFDRGISCTIAFNCGPMGYIFSIDTNIGQICTILNTFISKTVLFCMKRFKLTRELLSNTEQVLSYL